MIDKSSLRPLIAGTFAVTLASTAIAIADSGLPNIPAHRHFVQNDQGLVQVGPRLCDRPNLQQAFNEFHSNVHHAVAGSQGPDQPASGLHNHRGGEIVAKACSFVP